MGISTPCTMVVSHVPSVRKKDKLRFVGSTEVAKAQENSPLEVNTITSILHYMDMYIYVCVFMGTTSCALFKIILY